MGGRAVSSVLLEFQNSLEVGRDWQATGSTFRMRSKARRGLGDRESEPERGGLRVLPPGPCWTSKRPQKGSQVSLGPSAETALQSGRCPGSNN